MSNSSLKNQAAMAEAPQTHTAPHCVSLSSCLLAFILGTAAGIAGYLFVKKQRNAKKNVRIEDLRKAYAGLSPDEEQ